MLRAGGGWPGWEDAMGGHAILTTSIVASLLFPKAAEAHAPIEHDPLPLVPDPVHAPIEPTRTSPAASGTAPRRSQQDPLE